MKKLLILIIILNTTLISSQGKQSLSASIFAGGFFHGGQFGAKNGFNFGTDLEARNNKFGVYLNCTYNYSKEIEDVNPNSAAGSVTILEIYGGPRWFIGNLKKIHGEIDGGLGYYRYQSQGSMGINFGLGLNYPLNNSFILAAKGKLHAFAENYVTSYGGLYLGIRYNFR